MTPNYRRLVPGLMLFMLTVFAAVAGHSRAVEWPDSEVTKRPSKAHICVKETGPAKDGCCTNISKFCHTNPKDLGTCSTALLRIRSKERPYGLCQSTSSDFNCQKTDKFYCAKISFANLVDCEDYLDECELWVYVAPDACDPYAVLR